MRRRAMTCVSSLVALAPGWGKALHAQAAGWHSVLEANANSLFGATSQTLTAISARLTHAGEGFNADASFKFRYGESEDEERVKFVSARGTTLALSVDGLPKGRFSPFFSANVETSLEKRIANRRSAGVGAKWIVARSNTGTASASVGLLGERTAALADTATPPVRVARWSWRVRLDQHVGERVSFSHATVYGPVFNVPAAYTVTSTSSAGVAINEALGFTLTFTDNYDSQARLRGAPTNNDGSLLFGIRAAFD